MLRNGVRMLNVSVIILNIGFVRPVAQLVERRTSNLLPVLARVRDASALDI